jgi:hypothetical protein
MPLYDAARSQVAAVPEDSARGRRALPPAFPVLLRIPRIRMPRNEPVANGPQPALAPRHAAAPLPLREPQRRPGLTFAVFVLAVAVPAYWFLGTRPATRQLGPAGAELGEIRYVPAIEQAELRLRLVESMPAVESRKPTVELLPETADVDEVEPGLKAALLPDIIPCDEGEP